MKPIRESALRAGLPATCTLFVSIGALAQVPSQPPYSPAYPAQQQSSVATSPAAGPPVSPVRNAFAATISGILRESVAAGTMGLSTLVSGAITGWFDRKSRELGPGGATPGIGGTTGYGTIAQGTTGYPPAATYPSATGYPAASSYPPVSSYPPASSSDPYATSSQGAASATNPGQPATTSPYPPASTSGSYPSSQSSPSTSYPSASYPSASPTTPPSASSPYPGSGTGATGSQVAGIQYFDSRTGQSLPSDGAFGSAPQPGDLYAGIAYEVHAVMAGGGSLPVNVATHAFSTGDRFLVHFRPALPGRVVVYNINALGQQSQIDAADMAAGQLTTLGPYEFAGTKGDETLRLVLMPCSTPQLLVATRDIVNVSGMTPTAGASMSTGGSMSPSAAMTPSVAMASCNRIGTRSMSGVTTRDIRRVAVDGSTSFALDQVSRTEISSGQWAPREVTIRLRHQ